MLMIRLQRVGRKNEPKFRVVLTDSKNGPKSGRSLETLGSYDSRPGKDRDNSFDGDKIKYWISKGAKLSDTMHNLLISAKVLTGKKINKLPKKSPIVKPLTPEQIKAAEAAKVAAAAPAPEAAPVVEAPAQTETPAA
ncbi:MAG: 30S ribosomal protein S16 [bacterium]